MEFRPGRQEAPRGNTSSSCRSKEWAEALRQIITGRAAAVADVRLWLSEKINTDLGILLIYLTYSPKEFMIKFSLSEL